MAYLESKLPFRSVEFGPWSEQELCDCHLNEADQCRYQWFVSMPVSPPMIRNEAEYQEASERLAEETLRFDEHRLRLSNRRQWRPTSA